MRKIAGVRFEENWKVYDFDAAETEVVVGDRVIVDSERGPAFARVVRMRNMPLPAGKEDLEKQEPGQQDAEPVREGEGSPPQPGMERQAPPGLRKILRKATEEDLARRERNRAREAEAFTVAQQMIAERELPMKLIRVEYSFDLARATFFFFSENRVDFRDLVKDLAFKLKSRIEMRQIGVRDVARLVGGFGPCGRELCCASHLRNFEPVSIRMAKKQEMVLNPAKISGVCGRLLCCLSYEFEMYDEIKKDLAGMREAAVKEKKAEDELRVAEERREADERRAAEEKKRDEERRQQAEQRREKQREGGQKDGQKGGRTEKKRGQQPEKKTQPRPQGEGQPRRRQQPPRPEKGPAPQQQAQSQEREQEQEQEKQPQQEGDQAARKKKRRFWRRKKKGPQQGEGNPQGPAQS